MENPDGRIYKARDLYVRPNKIDHKPHINDAVLVLKKTNLPYSDRDLADTPPLKFTLRNCDYKGVGVEQLCTYTAYPHKVEYFNCEFSGVRILLPQGSKANFKAILNRDPESWTERDLVEMAYHMGMDNIRKMNKHSLTFEGFGTFMWRFSEGCTRLSEFFIGRCFLCRVYHSAYDPHICPPYKGNCVYGPAIKFDPPV